MVRRAPKKYKITHRVPDLSEEEKARREQASVRAFYLAVESAKKRLQETT